LSLTQRLIVGALLVCSVFAVLTVTSLGIRVRGRLRAETATELLREARLVGAQWRPGLDLDSLADEAGRALGHRVTLIGTDGIVLGDSDFDQPALGRLEDHSGRPEFIEASGGDSGWSTRVNTSVSGNAMYAAIRTPYGVARVAAPLRVQEALLRQLQFDVMLVAGGALALALVLASLFAHSVTRPILELRNDAVAIAGGDLERRPALNASAEIGELASAFYRLAEQLSARLRALEADDALLRALMDALNEGAIAFDARQQVVHLNARARQLLGVRDQVPFPGDRLPRDRILQGAVTAALAGVASDSVEVTLGDRNLTLTARPLASGGAVVALFDLTPLRRLETVRRDFVANVSHELKTPLTVVGGFAETLVEDGLDAGQRNQFASAIVSNTRRMQRIVDDLLDLSRIESGGWTPKASSIEVEGVARDALAPLRARAESKGLTLRIDVDPPTLRVHADFTAVRQVLTNLVDNAVRHTDAGEVVVAAREDGDGVSLSVRDTGAGIGPEHLPRIFERFYRVDAARSREEGGTGLGLAIVKHLVEAHGGRVQATSERERGTTIEAWFPHRAATGSAA
jgi:signal transduction histidine kinase